MTFPSINPALDRALVARDYATPTAVQLAVLAPEAASRDLLVSAQTGSGKTVAFGLAMAKTLLGDAEKFEPAAGPLALIIAPTRELAMQVQRELDWLYAETGARIVTTVGGMDPRAEARQLALGATIVVGTPGRLRDHIERQRFDFSALKSVVLDEADEMLDLGFREDLEFILNATPAARQTLLFSATMPREIEALAKSYQRDAVRIETVNRNEQHADIAYRAIRVAPSDAENAVVNVLRFHEPRAALVFCTTREAVKRMHARLVERGFAAVALSGELTQQERTQALVSVRDGRARVLVATDVAARGLDLPDLALVIHAELPHDRETLLHRSGRTGRAGKKGLCVLIVPFNRRRKAEGLLGAARLQVTWGSAPSAEEIRAKDQERFLADAIFTEAATEADLALAKLLQDAHPAETIALALVRLHRSRLPEPEDIAEDTGPPRRDDRPRTFGRDKPFERHDAQRSERPRPWERRERADATSGNGAASGNSEVNNTSGSSTGGTFEARPPRPPRRPREDNREMIWFRLNIGRNRNADPKWILPLICNAGGITKSEVGSIKIHDLDTRFQIVAEHAEQFELAARTNKNKQGHIARVGANFDAQAATEDDVTVLAAIDAIAPKPAPASPPAPAPELKTEVASKPAPTQAPPAKPAVSSKPAPSPAAKAAPTQAPPAKPEASSKPTPPQLPAPHHRPKSKWREGGRDGNRDAPGKFSGKKFGNKFAGKKPAYEPRKPARDAVSAKGPSAAKGPDAKYLHKNKHRAPTAK